MQGKAKLRVLQMRVLHPKPAQFPASPEERARRKAQGVRVLALPVRFEAQPEVTTARAYGSPVQWQSQQKSSREQKRRKQQTPASATGPDPRAA